MKSKFCIALFNMFFFSTGVTSIVKYAPSAYGAGNQTG
jgi:hypothetical protein